MMPHFAPETGIMSSEATPTPEESLVTAPLLQAPRTDSPGTPAAADDIPPVLKRIAFCESSDRHFDDEGSVIRGKVNPDDIGRYQINVKMWGGDAKKLGHDIFTEEGNLMMALHLYEKQGVRPWHWSRKCWER